MVKQFPCEVHVGDYLITADGRRWKISQIDGKYFHTEDGNRFSFKHPDIVSVDAEEPTEEEILEEAIEEVRKEHLEEEEKKAAPKKKSKKKAEVQKEDAE